MEIKDLLYGVLTKTLNKTTEELDALLYQKADDSEELVLVDEALDLVLDADVSRVDKIKKGVKPDPERLKNEYSRGKKEALEKLETDLRETFETTSDANGLDLVKAIVADASKSKKTFTDDDVKKHPLYLELEKSRVPKEDYDSLDAEFKEFKENQAKNVRLSSVKKDVMTIFNTLNAIQSKNQNVAKNRLDDFVAKFDQYDYELQDDGNHLILKEGSRLEDAHGNPVKFKDFVSDTAQLYYDFEQSQQRGNAGNTGDTNGSGDRVDVPKTEADYLKYMANEPDPAKRIAVKNAFMASQNN